MGNVGNRPCFRPLSSVIVFDVYGFRFHSSLEALTVFCCPPREWMNIAVLEA